MAIKKAIKVLKNTIYVICKSSSDLMKVQYDYFREATINCFVKRRLIVQKTKQRQQGESAIV